MKLPTFQRTVPHRNFAYTNPNSLANIGEGLSQLSQSIFQANEKQRREEEREREKAEQHKFNIAVAQTNEHFTKVKNDFSSFILNDNTVDRTKIAEYYSGSDNPKYYEVEDSYYLGEMRKAIDEKQKTLDPYHRKLYISRMNSILNYMVTSAKKNALREQRIVNTEEETSLIKSAMAQEQYEKASMLAKSAVYLSKADKKFFEAQATQALKEQQKHNLENEVKFHLEEEHWDVAIETLQEMKKEKILEPEEFDLKVNEIKEQKAYSYYDDIVQSGNEELINQALKELTGTQRYHNTEAANLSDAKRQILRTRLKAAKNKSKGVDVTNRVISHEARQTFSALKDLPNYDYKEAEKLITELKPHLKKEDGTLDATVYNLVNDIRRYTEVRGVADSILVSKPLGEVSSVLTTLEQNQVPEEYKDLIDVKTRPQITNFLRSEVNKRKQALNSDSVQYALDYKVKPEIKDRLIVDITPQNLETELPSLLSNFKVLAEEVYRTEHTLSTIVPNKTAKQIADIFNTKDVNEIQNISEIISQSLGEDAELLWTQLDKVGLKENYALYGYLSSQNKTALIHPVRQGLQNLKANPSLFKDIKDDLNIKINEMYASLNEDLNDPDVMADRVYKTKAIKALYANRLLESGKVEPTSVDEEILSELFFQTTGATIKIGDSLIVPPFREWDKLSYTTWLRKVKFDDYLKKLNYVPTHPSNSPNRLRRALNNGRVRYIGTNKYLILDGNGYPIHTKTPDGTVPFIFKFTQTPEEAGTWSRWGTEYSIRQMEKEHKNKNKNKNKRKSVTSHGNSYEDILSP